jgi:uncharacterized membrane protein
VATKKQSGGSWPIFLLALAGAAVFIRISGQQLPETMASHFDATGNANGFMARDTYLNFITLIAVGAPLLIVIVQTLVLNSASSINIPNRDYWLAPERRDDTLAYLNKQGMRFGILLAAFLSYVHWIVVKGNAVQPPQLSNGLFIPALMVFFVATGVWISTFYFHFRRP